MKRMTDVLTGGGATAGPPSEFYARRADEGFTVQQTAERTGLSEHNLRYYERVGLLEPVRRKDRSGHRRYSAIDIAKIETLACLRALGMPIDQMRRYFELAAQGAAAAPQVRALLEAQQELVEERLRQMQQHLAYVQHKIEYWRAIETDDKPAAAGIARKFQKQIKTAARRS